MRKRKSRVKILAPIFFLIAFLILLKIITSIFGSRNSTVHDFIFPNLDKNMFSKFSYKTFDTKGREIVVLAENVSEEKKDVYAFNKIKSTFELSDGENGLITADKIIALHQDKTICEFIGNVQLSTSSGLIVKTEKTIMDFNTKIAKGNKKISISNRNTKISANKYIFDLANNKATLLDNVNGDIDSGRAKKHIFAQHATVVFNKFYTNYLKSVKLTGTPILKSSNYELRSIGDIFFENDTITASSKVVLIYKNNNDKFYIKSNKMFAKSKGSKILSITALGNLRIKTKDTFIKADNGIFDDNKIIVFKNVIIINDYGTAFGDIAELDLKTGKTSLKKSRGILCTNGRM